MTQSLDIDGALAERFYEQMLLIRRFEEKCAEEYAAGRIRGFLHLYIGEEAVATGIINALEPNDAIFATYREHAHALLCGIDPGRIMAEMFGRVEGVSRGRGGSMHLFERSRNFFGGNAIVASAIPVAVGYGLATKQQEKRGITVCFFGEGAVAEGDFHEAMNLAALWQAPVLFVCENNLYAMGTSLERSESQIDLCQKAQSYGVKTERVDGMDVVSVYLAGQRSIKHIRENVGPYFLQCDTYRFRAHSMFDPELYRDKAEVETWRRRDPVVTFAKRLTDSGILKAEDLSRITRVVDELVFNAVFFAEQGHLEPLSELTRFVYSEPCPIEQGRQTL